MATTLTLIILGSALAAAHIGTTGAVATQFDLWAVLGPDRFYGYYAGYHDIWYRIQPELAKIGINLNIYIQGDMYDNWYLIWEAPLGGQPPGKPPGAWDLTSMEWWIHPHGFLWMDGIILSEMIPPAGFNVEPYLRQENDRLYKGMQTHFDAEVRKRYAWEWQEFSMRDPPILNWYYPGIFQLRSKYIGGWYATTWWYDISNLFIDQAKVEELKIKTGDPLGLNYERLARTLENPNTTIIYGAGEAWWSYLNAYCDSYTEEAYQNLVSGCLYTSSLDPFPVGEAIPQVEDFTVRNYLATSDPEYVETLAEAEEPDGKVEAYKIKLREDVKWSDYETSGEIFDAEDVKFSHDYQLDPLMLGTAYGDFAPIVKRVEYCNSTGHKVDSPDVGQGYDKYTIRYVLYDDYVDLKLILGNTWGAGIMPKHYLVGINPYSLRNSPTNKNFAAGSKVPSIGPYKYYAESPPSGYADITFERNPLYFGYNASLVGGSAWGPYGIDYIIMKYSPDAEVRFAEMQTHVQDIAEYPTAPVPAFEALPTDEFFLMKAPYSASNDVWINFNNPQLSNRYVRLAIAYATPYGEIFSDILPSWGIVDPVPPKSWVLPWQVYTSPVAYGNETVRLYNTEIDEYTHDIDMAQKYMNMWLYSQQGQPFADGPIGDANFDGIVNLKDIHLTLDEIARYSATGDGPLTRPLSQPYGWWNISLSGGIDPWPVASGASYAPGNDVDADFDNDGDMDSTDFSKCVEKYGEKYPEGAVW